jgi:Dirigent-like protein
MGRRRLTAIATLAATTAIIGTVAVASGPSAAATSERYYVKETWHAFSGNPNNGKPTDIYAFQDTVTSTSGKQVGSVNGYAVNLHPPFVAWSATAILPSGTLTVAASYSVQANPSTLQIVGGTGSYLGARGTVTLTDAGSRGSLAVITLAS